MHACACAPQILLSLHTLLLLVLLKEVHAMKRAAPSPSPGVAVTAVACGLVSACALKKLGEFGIKLMGPVGKCVVI